MRRLRCLPALVQTNRRYTKGYLGFSVENDMLRVNGLVLGRPPHLLTYFCCSRRYIMENVTLLFETYTCCKTVAS